MVKDKTIPYAARDFKSPIHVVELAKELIGDFDREVLLVLCLNTRHKLTCVHMSSIGTADMTIADPREILKIALVSNATAIILCHNHPSGDVFPSNEDLVTTRKIKEAAELLNVHLLDHVIIGDDKHYSMADEKVM